MTKLESLLRERGPNGLAGWSSWPGELAGMQRALAAQLGDLRSQILREACKLLLALAEASPRDFFEEGGHLLAFFAPILAKSLYVTIKIMSTTADDTLAALVDKLAAIPGGVGVRVGVPVFLALTNDVHAVVREKCANYLLQIVRAAAAASTSSSGIELVQLESALPGLLSACRTHMQAQDGPVRLGWRHLFSALRSAFPPPHPALDAVQNDLPAVVTKALEMDRKAAAGIISTQPMTARASAAIVGAKRKKQFN
jgi:hypothetical protein